MVAFFRLFLALVLSKLLANQIFTNIPPNYQDTQQVAIIVLLLFALFIQTLTSEQLSISSVYSSPVSSSISPYQAFFYFLAFSSLLSTTKGGALAQNSTLISYGLLSCFSYTWILLYETVHPSALKNFSCLLKSSIFLFSSYNSLSMACFSLFCDSASLQKERVNMVLSNLVVFRNVGITNITKYIQV